MRYDSPKTSHTVTKLTSIYRQGWEKDPVTGDKKKVPRESLGAMKVKHRCYHEGKWEDQDSLNDPIPTPNSNFGVAYVGLDDMDRADQAIKELDRTGYVSFEPPFTPILY